MPRAASQEAIVNRGKGSPALSYRSSIEAFPRRYPALAALLLGVAAACGFAPLEYWWLAIAAFAGWIALVHAAPTRGQALWRGWSFGVGHFTINDNWFQHAFTFQDQMPPWLGYAAPFALALYLAVFPALCAGLAWRGRAARIDVGFVLLFGACWILTEWMRSWLFTGYAWDPVAVMWVPVQPVAWLATLVGTYALSGLTVVAAGALLLLPAGRRQIGIGIVTFAILTVAELLSYRGGPTPPAADAPRLVVVQPNVPQDQRGESDQAMMLARLLRLSGTPGAAPRLVMWPEGVIRDFIEDDYPFWVYGNTSPWLTRERMASVLGPRDMLLTGGTALQFDGKGDVTTASNSVFALDARGRIRGRYDKAHLVPYGEYLPMPWLLKPLGLSRLVPGDMDFAPGPGPRTMTVPGFGAIGMQLCYEIIFSGQVVDPAQRPRLIFNPSNDAWFGTWGPPQHLAQARLRAIEEGLPVVRATPNGISAVIAANGALLATVAHHVGGAAITPIPPAHAPTLFSLLGNWAALLVGAALTLVAFALRRRSR
ncbi:apolipoprotein N-acyltransferase [Sphingomonas endophytica]|uniref:Apolipoprotein N-acyltransferase n=1 Tax=Sphingomonas endophytica TaxID=869719 RepID=A0A7X0JF57_9SPHN|nr:apolipoprotein N-acyltransferase [Sphingomonas endophytica]MBB6506444.1 apolipoprotein N-acyltransferase [Sphingomonas endophytica]